MARHSYLHPARFVGFCGLQSVVYCTVGHHVRLAAWVVGAQWPEILAKYVKI